MPTARLRTFPLPLLAALSLVVLVIPGASAAVTARYVRVENPTGTGMEWQEIEVYSGVRNVVLHQGAMFSGTVVEGHDPKTREGTALTDGRKDTHVRGADFRAPLDPVTHAPTLDPWFEIDLGRLVAVDRIVLFASRYPERLFMDKGNRLVTTLDADRRVIWSAKCDYYDKAHYPEGVFTFAPSPAPAGDPVVGRRVPRGTGDWVPMGWLLGADQMDQAPDAAARLRSFANRNSPAEVERLARDIFPLLADDVPELAEARGLFAGGRYGAALDGWKRYWFAKMKQANLHAAVPQDFFGYSTQADDLLNGISVTIGNTSARATRFTPGAIHWIDLPAAKSGDKSALANALTDCEQKAQVGRVGRALLVAYGKNPDPRYLTRWAEIMDDWSLHFFTDAASTPYEVEMLFTFNPCIVWAILMEELSDLAVLHPALIDQMPATTLARMQLLCIEKYSTAWWRQARETVFNHETGGIFAWGTVLPYIDEFHPGRRAALEWRQEFERWMTLGTEPDGSMTEIGDEGHMGMSALLGFPLARLEQSAVKPDWYTPGWRNRAIEWYDGVFKYVFRHLAPGGYEHRFAVGYRTERWLSTTQPYFPNHPQNPPPLNRDAVIFGTPEIRRILDAVGHISSGRPVVTDPLRRGAVEAQQRSHDEVVALLGADKPGRPHINSDWMPYTGAYYFRGGWGEDDAFLAMMACGSHGGAQPTQWPYGMFYFYDHGFPLLRSQPLHIDGLPPSQLFGRQTFQPGTKTEALTNAQEQPAPHRWHTSDHFDFGEAIFQGAYQNLPGFKNDWDYALEQVPAAKAVTNVRTSRQILHLRDSRMFIVTDAVRFLSPEDQARPHQLSVPLKFSLSTTQKNAPEPLAAKQLKFDEKSNVVASDNPGFPSVVVHEFCATPMKYRRGRDAKADFKEYSPRLGSNIGVADQDLSADCTAIGGASLVHLIASRAADGTEPIAAIDAMNRGATIAGFHATLRDGGEVWYQASVSAVAEILRCGPAVGSGQALLLATTKNANDPIRGLLLGGTSLSLGGKVVAITHPDFEFSLKVGRTLETTVIFSPIDPVRFLPDRNTFVDSLAVELVSETPGVQIRYTTDGTQPTPDSTLYSSPLTITQTTEFAARAYRLGTGGKPLAAEEFEINGTRFSSPTYGWFRKQSPLPAINVSESDLEPGLNCDYLQAPWYRLYASADRLPASTSGVTEREMDLSKVTSAEPFGMRYHGYLKIPQDGVYTFHAPHELVYMDSATSYDLRVYVDGQEWDLTQWWHGHGTWSVPLRKGFHAFQVDFADARSTPWRKSGIWRYYPRPWVIYQGKPTDILLSGPSFEPARIPREWLHRKPTGGGSDGHR